MTLVDIPTTTLGVTVYVNPKHVSAVVVDPSGGSIVRFGDGYFVETDLTASEVVRRLECAEAP